MGSMFGLSYTQSEKKVLMYCDFQLLLFVFCFFFLGSSKYNKYLVKKYKNISHLLEIPHLIPTQSDHKPIEKIISYSVPLLPRNQDISTTHCACPMLDAVLSMALQMTTVHQ